MASFVVVFPALPVTPITSPPQCNRAHAPKSASAFNVSLTNNSFGVEFYTPTPFYHHRRSPLFGSRGDKVMPVMVRAAKRKIHVARNSVSGYPRSTRKLRRPADRLRRAWRAQLLRHFRVMRHAVFDTHNPSALLSPLPGHQTRSLDPSKPDTVRGPYPRESRCPRRALHQ